MGKVVDRCDMIVLAIVGYIAPAPHTPSAYPDSTG